MSDGPSDFTRNMGLVLLDLDIGRDARFEAEERNQLLRLEACAADVIDAAKHWRDSRATRGRATHEDVVTLEDAVDTLRVAEKRSKNA